jgi:phytoene synthase
LPHDKKQAVRALYAFCRTTDDIVDFPSADMEQRLAYWEQMAGDDNPPHDDPVAVAWVDTRNRYDVPRAYAVQLIDGMRRDLTQTRYATFEDLITYCYGVASTVGLMSMHIIGFRSEAAVRYAVKLGVALQLTNILRDIAEDFQRGRCYLPQDELRSFGVSEEAIAAGVVDENWRAFMRFQVERTRRIYAEAWPGIAMLQREGQMAIAAAATFYRAILDDIEDHDYDVFSRRAHVGKWGKLRRVPGLWWRYRVRA